MAAIRRLSLRSFRSYERLDLSLDDGLTLLCGSNGVGKTNVLEACALVLAGASPRTSSEFRCIRDGNAAARIEAGVENATGRTTRAVIIQAGAGKRLVVDGATVRSVDGYADIPVVTFLPERLLVVRGAPARRRAVLDRLAALLSRMDGQVVREYGQAIVQRNAVLRQGRSGRDISTALQPWTELVVERGERLRAVRDELVAALQPHVASRFAAITGLAPATMRLALRGPDMAQALQELRDAERRRGTTLAGPHLDDVLFETGGRDLRTHGSTGEQRATLLAWALAEHDLLRERSGESPVVLLDEPYSELDADRRQRLTGALADITQVLVTATEPPRHLLNPATLLRVRSGTVSPWTDDVDTPPGTNPTTG